MDIAIIVTSLGVFLTILNILDRILSSRNRIKEAGAREALTEADVSALRSGNATILVTLDKIDGKIDNHAERITRVEERTNEAHKRLDKLENKL